MYVTLVDLDMIGWEQLHARALALDAVLIVSLISSKRLLLPFNMHSRSHSQGADFDSKRFYSKLKHTALCGGVSMFALVKKKTRESKRVFLKLGKESIFMKSPPGCAVVAEIL